MFISTLQKLSVDTVSVDFEFLSVSPIAGEPVRLSNDVLRSTRTIILTLALSVAMLAPFPEGARGHDTEVIQLHKPVYFLVGENENNQTEFKYQLSLMTNPFGTDWKFGGSRIYYNQTSWWDFGERSGPFRESNYNFGAMWRFTFDDSAFRQWDVGFEHESNGQDDIPRPDGSVPTRSWDRYFTEVQIDIGDDLMVQPKLWYAINTDENEDILDTYGVGELLIAYRAARRLEFHVRGRHGSKRGIVFVDGFWSITENGPVKLHVQWFDGFGESLIDIPGTDDPDQDPRRRSQLRIGFAVLPAWAHLSR